MTKVNETQTRKELLAYITSTAVAESETDMQPLLDIFNPGSMNRDEMGAKFNDVLGYNPITHFDFQDILAAVDRIRIDEADADLASELVKFAQPLANRAMQIFEERRSVYLDECLAEAGMELLPRAKAEEFSTLLIGRIFEDVEDSDEGVAAEIDDVTLDLDADPVSDSGIEDDFGLEDDDD